jgi:hypothetical protein
MAVRKIVQKLGSKMMTRETNIQCSLVELNGLIQVRQDIQLHASVLKTTGKVA